MVMLAFPGMGKTPLAKRNPIYFDLDFGFFRTALNVPKEQEVKLLQPFAKLAKLYSDQGYIVLTNEPKLMQVMKITKIYLPKDVHYSARKMHVSNDQIQEWVDDWATMAKKYNVPVIWISTGLDHYLAKGGHRK